MSSGAVLDMARHWQRHIFLGGGLFFWWRFSLFCVSSCYYFDYVCVLRCGARCGAPMGAEARYATSGGDLAVIQIASASMYATLSY
jgi:hypothetical protein